MKKLFLLCLSLLLIVGCDDKKKHYIGNESNYGHFVFTSEYIVVDVEEDTNFFRLEGRYLEQPDADVYGDVWLYIDTQKTTAKYPEQFEMTKFVKFKEGENGTLYHDVTIHPENITSWVEIHYHTETYSEDINGPVNSLSKDSKIKVILRPKANE